MVANLDVLRICVVISHPIQHFCPMFVSWAKNPEICLKVFFASNIGLQSYKDENFDREIKWGSLYLDDFPHLFLNGNNTLPIDGRLDAENLEMELLKFQPDIVVQYGRNYNFNSRLRKWALSNNVKIGYVSDSESRHSENWIKLIIKNFYYRFYFRKIHLFFSVGDSNEDFYLKCGVSRDKIIRMNFSIDKLLYDKFYLNKLKLKDDLRERLNIASDDFVISVVGKLVEWKNQLDLVSLLVNLEKSVGWPKVHLIVAGSGPNELNMRDLAATLDYNCVHFLGFVDPEDLPAVYAACDVYVHPSKYEPHSLAVSEAIYMGLPIFVSHTSGSHGPSDDVRQNENGGVYELSNLVSLEEQLKTMLDVKKREEYSRRSKEIANHAQDNAHFEFINKLIKYYRIKWRM